MTTQQIRHNNRTILDLKKVAYACFYYRSGEYQRQLKPAGPTVRGQDIGKAEMALFHKDYPNETLVDRAKRLGLVDKWIPVAVFIMNNGHRLEFTGKRAVGLREAYVAMQFKQPE